MVIGIFGESCAGKSTIADELARKANAKVYTGKDYVKMAKNEADAKRQFVETLKSNEATDDVYVYVISEKEHMQILPEKALRVLVTAGLDKIKERFAKRMNGNLPAAVAAMLEKKHGAFDDEKHDLKVENTEGDVSGICDRIMGLGHGKSLESL